MPCYTSCVIATALIAAILFVNFSPGKVALEKKYISLLNEKQRTHYEKIRKERLSIFIKGFIVSVLLAFGIVWYLKKSLFTNVCLVGAIVFIFQYFFYVFYPKSSYMITELDTKEEREAWLAIYKHMTFYYHVGFVVGVLGAMLFCYGVYKK